MRMKQDRKESGGSVEFKVRFLKIVLRVDILQRRKKESKKQRKQKKKKEQKEKLKRKRECLIERRMGLSNAQSSIFCIFFYQIIPGAISRWAKLRRTPPSC